MHFLAFPLPFSLFICIETLPYKKLFLRECYFHELIVDLTTRTIACENHYKLCRMSHMAQFKTTKD